MCTAEIFLRTRRHFIDSPVHVLVHCMIAGLVRTFLLPYFLVEMECLAQLLLVYHSLKGLKPARRCITTKVDGLLSTSSLSPPLVKVLKRPMRNMSEQ